MVKLQILVCNAVPKQSSIYISASDDRSSKALGNLTFYVHRVYPKIHWWTMISHFPNKAAMCLCKIYVYIYDYIILNNIITYTYIYIVKSAQLPFFPLILGGPCAQIPMEMGQLIGHEICTGPKV